MLTQFESYVVKGAHCADAAQMGIYNPGVPPVFTPSEMTVFFCLMIAIEFLFHITYNLMAWGKPVRGVEAH